MKNLILKYFTKPVYIEIPNFECITTEFKGHCPNCKCKHLRVSITIDTKYCKI